MNANIVKHIVYKLDSNNKEYGFATVKKILNINVAIYFRIMGGAEEKGSASIGSSSIN